jgi:hypothetical protein
MAAPKSAAWGRKHIYPREFDDEIQTAAIFDSSPLLLQESLVNQQTTQGGEYTVFAKAISAPIIQQKSVLPGGHSVPSCPSQTVGRRRQGVCPSLCLRADDRNAKTNLRAEIGMKYA